MTSHLNVDGSKLPSPLHVVQERSQIESVVVWGVTLGMVGRGEYRHLVAIDGITTKKEFHFVHDLSKRMGRTR